MSRALKLTADLLRTVARLTDLALCDVAWLLDETADGLSRPWPVRARDDKHDDDDHHAHDEEDQ